MSQMNWVRVILSGLVAGVTWTVLSSIVTVLAGARFAAAVPNNHLLAPTIGFVAFLFAVNLAEGIWAMWLYATIRPRYRSGVKTAAVVGVAWWVISTLIDATWGSFGFVSAAALVGPILGSVPAILVAAFAGAWFYGE